MICRAVGFILVQLEGLLLPLYLFSEAINIEDLLPLAFIVDVPLAEKYETTNKKVHEMRKESDSYHSII